VCCRVLPCGAVCCSVLPCVAVWCSVLRCVAGVTFQEKARRGRHLSKTTEENRKTNMYVDLMRFWRMSVIVKSSSISAGAGAWVLKRCGGRKKKGIKKERKKDAVSERHTLCISFLTTFGNLNPTRRQFAR